MAHYSGINAYGVPADPAARTKLTHPYSYDPITQFRSPDVQANGTVYTDRMLGWDSNKLNTLSEKHFGNRGQHWDRRGPLQIEAFLRDWFECSELRLSAVIEYCNQSTGYPTWRLDYFLPQPLA